MRYRAVVLGALWALGVSAQAVAEVESNPLEMDKRTVLDSYVDRAQALYEDALEKARDLQKAVKTLITDPSAVTLEAAREAWRASRPPYAKTEVYRFGNEIVEAWETRVNAWPLDEGLIDYVDAAYGGASKSNPFATANVIAHRSIPYGDQTVDVSKITKTLLTHVLQQAGGMKTNVATGYHVIEFLLWGEPSPGPTSDAGTRPWTDYAWSQCTHGHCDRRARYLATVTDLLVDDLAWMAAQWAPDGAARAALAAQGMDGALSALLTGMGSLSYGELAGERMKRDLLLHDSRMEQDRFSDSTCADDYYDIVGIRDLYLGVGIRASDQPFRSVGIAPLFAKTDPDLNKRMIADLDKTDRAAQRMKARCDHGESYRRMTAEDNPEGNAVVQAVVDALVDQSRTIERLAVSFGLPALELKGSDSLDDPEKVFRGSESPPR